MKKVNIQKARKRTYIKQKNWKRRKTRDSSNKVFGKFDESTIVFPPSINFESSNIHRVTKCLKKMKIATLSEFAKARNSIVYIDLSSVVEISLDAAFVLAAEIDRCSQIPNIRLKPHGLKNWNNEIKSLLNSFGIFYMLRVDANLNSETESNANRFDLLVYETINVHNTNELSKKIGELLNTIRRETGNIELEPQIYSALYEAALNVRLHAYNKRKLLYESVEKCWIAVFFERKSQILRILTYDRGIGIPAALPLKKLENLRFEVFKGDDASLLLAATTTQRTSLGGGHGQGLKCITLPTEILEDCKVRISSGRGNLILQNKEKIVSGIVKFNNHYHIGGTLIDWTIPLDQVGNWEKVYGNN